MYTLYSDKASNLCLGTQTYSNFKGIFPHKKNNNNNKGSNSYIYVFA